MRERTTGTRPPVLHHHYAIDHTDLPRLRKHQIRRALGGMRPAQRICA
jgi:hypothetical protein